MKRNPRGSRHPPSLRRNPIAFDAMSDRSIAIIGASCRFPGAVDLEAYWRLLASGTDAISEVDERQPEMLGKHLGNIAARNRVHGDERLTQAFTRLALT